MGWEIVFAGSGGGGGGSNFQTLLAGDDVTETFHINHNLNSDYVTLTLITQTGGFTFFTTEQRIDANNVDVIFGDAPATGENYLVSITAPVLPTGFTTIITGDDVITDFVINHNLASAYTTVTLIDENGFTASTTTQRNSDSQATLIFGEPVPMGTTYKVSITKPN